MSVTLSNSRDDASSFDRTNLMAFLYVLKKAHRSLVGKDNAQKRFAEIKTPAHARKYIAELMPQLLKEREQHRNKRKNAQQ